jgi:hypothetical protein
VNWRCGLCRPGSAAASGTLRFRPSGESDALVRVYFANPDDEDFGETEPFRMNGKRGAEVYIRPDVDAMGTGPFGFG